MIENPYLTPWIIPRWAIVQFCELVNSYSNDYFVYKIIEHSPLQYLVITYGSDLTHHNNLKEFLFNLFDTKVDVF